MNLLNEEIRAIQHTIAHLKMAIPLEQDSGRKHKLKEDLKELTGILEDKLEKCEDL